MNEITVYCRCNNPRLYEKMLDFIPDTVKVLPIMHMDEWQDASRYLYKIIGEYPTKYAINIDIDCFVFNWPAVIDMVEYMRVNEMMHSGMPDGGVHPGRSHAWTTMNPFFNIFDVEMIRSYKSASGLSWEQIERHGYISEWDENKPSWITGPCNYDNREPFHGLFNWLYSCGTPLLMHPARVADNQLDTYLKDPAGIEFCVHAWYSRQYDSDPATKYRIDYLYEQAKELRNGI